MTTHNDAFLYGRINGGNVACFAYGDAFGWISYDHFKDCLNGLFDGPFGCGYPQDMALRKQADMAFVHHLNKVSKHRFLDVLETLDKEKKERIYAKRDVIAYCLKFGKDNAIVEYLKREMHV